MLTSRFTPRLLDRAKIRARASGFVGLLIACLLVCGWVTGCGVTPGPGLASPLVWVKQYGAQQLQSSAETLGFGPEAATALAADSAGNVLVTGYVAGSFAGFTGDPGVIDAYLTKYAPDGTLLWLKQFPSPAGALLSGVATDSANNIVATGSVFSDSSNPETIFVAKTDPNGNPLWYVALPASASSSFGTQVKVEQDGSIIVAGFGFFDGSSQETLLVARLSGVDGHVLWVEPFALPAEGLLTGLTLDAAGNPLLVGVAGSPDGSIYPYVVKLQQGDGSIAWVHQITAAANSMIPFAIAADSAGNALVGGGTFTGPLTYGFTASPQESAVLYKFNAADGTQQWTKSYSTGKGDVITGVQTIASGTIYALGYTNGQFNSSATGNTQNTIFLLNLTSGGTLSSAYQFGTGPLQNATAPFGPLTAMDTSGNIFVSGATTNAYPGFTNSAHALQMFIAKLTPTPLLQY